MRAVRLGALSLALAVVACASGSPTPEWQVNAKSSVDRAVAAYLTGDTRTSTAEFERARSEIARTGRIDLLARAELMLCAAKVASLVFEPCEGFEKLHTDAAAPERAYADYLGARIRPDAVALLPSAQRDVAAKRTSDDAPIAAVKGIDDPLSRLVAAGVLFQSGKANPALLSLAVETASAQGWRRPMLAWLGAQRMGAEKAGDANAEERLRRQIDVIEQTPGR
jgi:hypothetical protein